MKIYLVNQTSSWHAGSAAIVSNLRQILIHSGHQILWETPRPHPMEKSLIEQCDAVVLNAEGALQEEAKGWYNQRARKLLEGLGYAKGIGKKAYLINAVWYRMEPTWKDLLVSLDGLSVRETASQREMLEGQGVKPDLFPDLSFGCPLAPTPPDETFRNRIVVGTFYRRYMKPNDLFDHQHAMFADMPRLSLGGEAENQDGNGPQPVSDWSQVVKNLAVSRLYVTGQQHGVYAACKAKVPFAVFRVHNHKISGLFEWCGVDIPIATTRAELQDAITWALQNRQVFERLFSRLESLPSWPGID